MGLFSKKGTCSICNKEIGSLQIANGGWICYDCFKKCGFNATVHIRNMTVEEIKAKMSANITNTEELSMFNTTKKIGTFLEIDDNQKKWLIPDGFMGKKKNPQIYKYSDIVDFELLEDGETITKGGLGRAIVGGVLFGGVGAVVGGVTGGKKSKSVCTSLKIKITASSIYNPVVYINFLTTPTKKNSFTYKTMYNSAQECLSVLQLICDDQGNAPVVNNDAPVTSSADEILKFKNLLDSGIITQEEYEAKKKQLLGL